MKDLFPPARLMPRLSAIVAAGLLAASLTAESLRLQVPTALPRGERLGDYSPWIALSYSGLRSEPYTLKVWLLEKNNWHCASTQWCERSFALGSGRESSADGTLQMTSSFDVFEYGPRLTWVARLYDGSGVEVASAQGHSKTVAAALPGLKPVGKRVGIVGQRLEVRLGASASKDDRITFRVHNAPDGVRVDPATGDLRWTPNTPGLYRIVVEAVAEERQLTDAELVELDIAQAHEADTGSGVKPE